MDRIANVHPVHTEIVHKATVRLVRKAIAHNAPMATAPKVIVRLVRTEIVRRAIVHRAPMVTGRRVIGPKASAPMATAPRMATGRRVIVHKASAVRVPNLPCPAAAKASASVSSVPAMPRVPV